MFWRNDLTTLRKENTGRIADMGEEMWEQLYPALQYLSIRQLSLFDRELIKSELIGIAEEAEIQGARLDRKMGMPYQAFCDFLIEKRGIREKSSIGEQLLETGTCFIWWLTFFAVVNLIQNDNAVRSNEILAALVAAMAVVLLGDHMFEYRGRLSVDQKKWRIQIGVMVVCFFVLAAVTSRYPIAIPLTAGRWIVIGILLVASVLLLLIRNWYWNSRSKQYNWKSE